jgi:putative oxidoreductase
MNFMTSDRILPATASATAADYWLLLARVCMASLFIFSGLEKIVKYNDFIGFASSGGLPFAKAVTPVVVFAELGCSAMLILGWNARIAAIFFAAFCAVLGPWFHQFWNATPEKWQEAIDGFFHHFVMAGGFVFIAAYGPGALSFDRRRTDAA